MRIAVASRDGRSIAGHIGKCADWIVFEVELPENPEAEPRVKEAERVTLPKEFVFHHYKDDAPHPLASCSVVIGASAGDSFVAKMQRRGMEVVLTAESDPATAVADYIQRTVTPAK
ncbi:MAG TPA: NifB/NifX family molybdenum-iron cluster-binding protein, partial [Mariprofundaceae bacterium]|nr:NifB/NifX family molybdenum-iron cluster-binding protein [Mariprofundaceae bacterium]